MLLRAYTLTSGTDGAAPPSAWRLVAADGRVLDERSGEQWPWPGQLRPFVLDEPVPLTSVRLELAGAGALSQIELLTT